MKTLSTRTAAIRMAVLIACVSALDTSVVLFTKQPLVWVRWVPGLIPLLTPLTVWEVLRTSEKTAK